jgi:glycosyltransferase involved in cell wall biosynthesis
LNPDSPEISILIPCLNEAATIRICVEKAFRAFHELGISGEVVVADNGSKDDSVTLATNAGARVIHVENSGYGSALIGGAEACQGKFIIMGDADDSYNFLEIAPFIEAWRRGAEFVMGNRFRGGIEPGAMPFLHQYLGNPVLSFIGRLFFSSRFGDFHCGMRGFTPEAFQQMKLSSPGMEFASEMIVKGSLLGISSEEVPVKLYKDGRNGPSHLNTWSDGWRHLRFLLLFSPRWLFFYPGLLFVFGGLMVSTLLTRAVLPFQTMKLDLSTLLYANCLVLIGFQLIFFYLICQAFARREGLSIQSGIGLGWFRLERGLIAGAMLLAAGLFLSFSALAYWKSQHFGPLNPQLVLRKVIPAVSLFLLGFQVISFSFYLSFLELGKRN